MKKAFLGLLLFAFLFSCGDRKAKINPFTVITELVDSASCPLPAVDTASVRDVPEEPKPVEADGLFGDFIFSYASDTGLQRQRTVFPLPYRHDGVSGQIEEAAWKHDSLFAGQNYYTILFDKEEDMELVGDTSLRSVRLEWIFLKEKKVKEYDFRRTKGMWRLEAIGLRPVKQRKGDDFIAFYTRFASDSLYQRRHICSPLQFITIDPDDEFSVLETTLDIDQWYAFRSVMPTEWLSNICYGQENETASRTKILKVNGIGNGYSNILYFRRKGSGWELYKYEDSSI